MKYGLLIKQIFQITKFQKNERFRYIFIRIDNFSNDLWAILLKNKNSQTITLEFSNMLTTSKRSPLKIESDRGKKWYNSVFQNFLKNKKIQHYARLTDKGPSIAERVNRTIRNLKKKPVFEKGNANWLSELPSVIKQYYNTIHNSIKITPFEASKKSNEKEVYSNLQHKCKKINPKFKPGDLVRASDIKRVFSKGDSTIWSYKLYTLTEVIHDTIPSYRIDSLLKR